MAMKDLACECARKVLYENFVDDGIESGYEYDNQGRLIRQIDYFKDAGDPSYAIREYAYDEFGRKYSCTSYYYLNMGSDNQIEDVVVNYY